MSNVVIVGGRAKEVPDRSGLCNRLSTLRDQAEAPNATDVVSVRLDARERCETGRF